MYFFMNKPYVVDTNENIIAFARGFLLVLRTYDFIEN